MRWENDNKRRLMRIRGTEPANRSNASDGKRAKKRSNQQRYRSRKAVEKTVASFADEGTAPVGLLDVRIQCCGKSQWVSIDPNKGNPCCPICDKKQTRFTFI
jgi:hypothetical protein